MSIDCLHDEILFILIKSELNMNDKNDKDNVILYHRSDKISFIHFTSTGISIRRYIILYQLQK